MIETRTVTFKVDPALSAYMAWIEEAGRTFNLNEFDVFAAGYREAARQQADQERA